MGEREVEGAAEDGEESPSAAPKASEPKPGAPHMVLRVLLGTAGLLLVVGFFLPWIQLPDDSHSGLTLVFDTNRNVREMVGETQRWILLVVPVLGAGLSAVGFLGFRWAGPVAAGVGITLLGYGAITVVMLFFQHTAIGLWLIVGGAFLALSAGMFGWIRARAAKLAASSQEPS